MNLGSSVANPKVVNLDRSVADGLKWNNPVPVPSNYKLTVAGWGIVNANNSRPQQLQSAEVLFLNDMLCGSYTQSKFGLEKLQSQVCTYSNTGAGTCEGDSGGPLILHKGTSYWLSLTICSGCKTMLPVI